MEPRSRGVLDTPHARGMTIFASCRPGADQKHNARSRDANGR